MIKRSPMLVALEGWRQPWHRRLPAWFWPGLLAVAATALVISGVTFVWVRQQTFVARQLTCAAWVETYFARNPRLKDGIEVHPDPCEMKIRLGG